MPKLEMKTYRRKRTYEACEVTVKNLAAAQEWLGWVNPPTLGCYIYDVGGGPTVTSKKTFEQSYEEVAYSRTKSSLEADND